jgi:spore coat polysaccharide biosynthesis protein SpsF
VLGRILGAAQSARATIHVQCWGDCAFVDPEQIDGVATALAGAPYDLVGNTVGGPPRALPFGLDVIALRVSALERADLLTRDNAYHREHGTTFLYENPDQFRVHQVEPAADLRHPGVRLVIDRLPDYEFVSQIYEALYPSRPDFGIRDVLALIRRTPVLLAHPNGQALQEPG